MSEKRIKCFMLTPTDRCARWLRRYLSAETTGRLCEPDGYHQAMVRIEDGPIIEDPEKHYISTDPVEWPADDPRWPARCQHCGYEFHEKEVRQLFYRRLYLTPDGQECCLDGGRTGLLAAPAGAMFYSDWWPSKSPDGHSLSVVLPDGVSWMIDGPSNNGDGWTRTGVPPIVTARPSILTNRYHGFLTDGYLIEC